MTTAAAGILVLAHGSRHPDTPAAVADIAAAAGRVAGLPAEAAFLDLCEPTPVAAAARLRMRGARELVAVPLLFTDAFHARIDVPRTLAGLTAHTRLPVRISAGLGVGNDVRDLLVRRADLLDDTRRAHVLVYAVGSADPQANAAVRGLAAAVGTARGTAASVGFATSGEPRGVAAVPADGPVVVLPLMTAPGLLWRRFIARVAADPRVRVGAPLGTDLGAMVAARAAACTVGARAAGTGADRDTAAAPTGNLFESVG